jgi:hypothetical protein
MKFTDTNERSNNTKITACFFIFTSLFSLLLALFCVTIFVLPNRVKSSQALVNSTDFPPSNQTYTIPPTTTASNAYHFHKKPSISNPRFSQQNAKGETCWTVNPTIKFDPGYSIDGISVQTPYYLFSKPAAGAFSADYLLDLDGKLVNFIRIFPEQNGDNRFEAYAFMVIYISETSYSGGAYPSNEIECSPRFSYDSVKIRDLDTRLAPMLFDCKQDVLSTRFLRVSNRAVHGTERDYVQIVEIQVGHHN